MAARVSVYHNPNSTTPFIAERVDMDTWTRTHCIVVRTYPNSGMRPSVVVMVPDEDLQVTDDWRDDELAIDTAFHCTRMEGFR